ncbi:MobF family relaxase [Gluconobacter cerinus]|uniref:MobF family relaxase n=1 Tax=Gluconobacter cerinus TaxID=38307 RepID=UPI001B8CBD39|nr:MobF family relaxase [Gluconobacter cerinus]MBS0984261.1 relaxase domain-containing protein [Gluconobacter cerinus]
MLTFRKGTGSFKAGAAAMADHLLEQTLPDELASMADYYLHDVVRSTAGSAARPRHDMDVSVANVLKIDQTRSATRDEIVNLLCGKAADGSDLPGAWRGSKSESRDRITYTDFTFSAPKSLSVAMAFAPTDAEWAILARAHRDSWQDSMAYIETIIGHARKGKGGSGGRIPGKIGWLSFDHYTSRPTVEVAMTDDQGRPATVIQTNNAAPGDMQTHTHVAVPNAVVCDDGSVGALDLLALHERVHEVGAFYQARLATRLREAGIDAELDRKTGTTKLTAIPDEIVDLFSKRTKGGEESARDYAKESGIDWDALEPEQKIAFLKGGAKATRIGKGDDMSDLGAWKAQAEKAGYAHQSVIKEETKGPDDAAKSVEADEPVKSRLEHAYDAALPFVEQEFERRAVLSGSVLRVAAARGLIATGTHTTDDIDEVVTLMCERGIIQAGERTSLIVRDLEGDSEAETLSERRQSQKVTTQAHVNAEEAVIKMASEAAADKEGQLTLAEIDRAVREVSERDGFDFTNEHGMKQREVMNKLGMSGRLGIAIGVAGAGKTTLLRPLIEAWKTQGRTNIYGVALAHRQSDLLEDAGIDAGKTMAIDKFLYDYNTGKIDLDRNSILVMDELSQVGTGHIQRLLELRKEHGFSIVGIGDDKQAQAISAGNSIKLFQKALGEEQVPVLESTVRMKRARDRETSLLFRSGNAKEGIKRLREDRTAVLVAGGRNQAIDATANKWVELVTANQDREDYKLTISAPTNRDARDISRAIRERRRKMGELGADKLTIRCSDRQGSEQYDVALAQGDRLRLYRVTRASFGEGNSGIIGVNGSVVEVADIHENGLILKNTKGKRGFVKWQALKDFERNANTDPFLLTYGDAITLDSIQSATSTDHIHVMPDGSSAVQSFKNYVGVSRSKESTFLIASDGRERVEVAEKRALGSERPITEDDVWNNIADNLARQPEKALAVDLLEYATEAEQKTSASMSEAFQKVQQREVDGVEPTNLHRRYQEKRDEKTVSDAAEEIKDAVKNSTESVKDIAKDIEGKEDTDIKKAAKKSRKKKAEDKNNKTEKGKNKSEKSELDADRPTPSKGAVPSGDGKAASDSMHEQQRATPRARNRPERFSEAEVMAEFADALRQAGLVVRGTPIMDGRRHRVDVEGEKRGRKSGMYIAHLDGYPAGYIHNHKTGEEIRWKASQQFTGQTDEERAAMREKIERNRIAREAARLAREEAVSLKASAIWRRAKAATQHPYLTKKDVFSHGLRIDGRGNLLVPMRGPEGKIWNLQTITPDGQKRFMKDGRKAGTAAPLGSIEGKGPIIVAEGYATAATMKETTGLPTVAAFDSGNLKSVVTSLKERHPERLIVIAGDNDHHLPRREINPLPNVGEVKATEAAKAVQGALLLPTFAPTDKGTDWNDFASGNGKAAVREKAALLLEPLGASLGAPITKQPIPAAVTQSARDSARSRSKMQPERRSSERTTERQTARPKGPKA